MLNFLKRIGLKAIFFILLITSIQQIINFTKDYVNEILASQIIEYDIASLKILRDAQKSIEAGNSEKALKIISIYNQEESKRLLGLCQKLKEDGKFKMKNEVKSALSACSSRLQGVADSSNKSSQPTR